MENLVDTASLIVWVRFFLGNLPTTEISDADMTIIIDSVLASNPTASDCLLKYLSLKAVIQWLQRKDLAASAGTEGSVGTGEIKSREEEIGPRKIKVTYDVGTSGGTSATKGGYQELLDLLESDPTIIGCSPFPSSTSTGTVIVGGVSQSQYDKVASNPDSRTGFAMGNLSRPLNRRWR